MPDGKNEESHAALVADLTSLVLEPTSEKRVELLRRITDAYIDRADKCTAAERYLFNEVVSKLIEKVSASARATTSAKLAQLPSFSAELAGKLAKDANIDVARPIIRDYKGLPEHILLDVAKTGSQAHLSVIAGRPVVTPPVSEVVVARGDDKTVKILAANRGAQFSDFGMQSLIDKSEDNADLQALIVAREGLPLTAISRLLPLISDELAGRLRDVSLRVDDVAVEKHLGDWAIERQHNVHRTDAYIKGVKSGDLNLNDVIREVVASGRLLDATTVLASVLELDRFFTFNTIASGKIQSALLLLRAVELSWPAAEAFINLRTAKAGILEYEAPPTREDYFVIDVGAAQRVVRFMKVRRAAKAG